MFRCNHHHQGAYYLSLLKLHLLKHSIKIHRCGLSGGIAAYVIRSLLVYVCRKIRCNRHHQGTYYLSLLKLHLLKHSIKIHRCGLSGGIAAYVIRSLLLYVCRILRQTYNNKDLITNAATQPD